MHEWPIWEKQHYSGLIWLENWEKFRIIFEVFYVKIDEIGNEHDEEDKYKYIQEIHI